MRIRKFGALEPTALSSAVMIGSVAFVMVNVIVYRFHPEPHHGLLLGVPSGSLLAVL